jgi:hypothetical protein
MPVVFATDAPTASGHKYDDVLGKQYVFPVAYEALVSPGDTFVYYRGRRGRKDGRPAYFGAGVVGAFRDSTDPEQLIVEVCDVVLFDEQVFAKAANGTYLETGTTQGTNWPNGVRRLSEEALERILRSGSMPLSSTNTPGTGPRGFASPQHASAMERYSVKVALELLGERFEAAQVHEMPAGNPGYDIVVRRPAGDLHVEVKGTVLEDPVFHLSEGQRQHAAARGTDFELIVVYAIEVSSETHRVALIEGPLDPGKVDLQPQAWTGRVHRPTGPVSTRGSRHVGGSP